MSRETRTQYILTYGNLAPMRAERFMFSMQQLARLQNNQYQTLFEILRHRGNEAAAEAGDKADAALSGFLMEFATEHGLMPVQTKNYLGGPTYPDEEGSVAIFDADFGLASSWKEAASQPIGDFHKRARVLPVNMITQNACEILSETHAAFEDQNLQPVVLELADVPEPVIRMTEAIGALSVPVISIHPKDVMVYLCREMNMQDCLSEPKEEHVMASAMAQELT